MTTDVNVTQLGNYQTSKRPRIIPIFTDAAYAAITTAGWFNSVSIQPVMAGDFVFVYYNNASNGIFTVSIDSSGVVTLAPLSSAGEMSFSGAAVVGNVPMATDTDGNQQDSGVPAANILQTTTDVTDYQQIVGINEILIASVGTWTRTRIAEGNYVLRHTAAADTSVIGVDITPAIRAAAGRGFKLASFDVAYSIGTLALNAHSVVLDKISYANNTAVLVTSVPLTVTLATATQAQPYLTNAVVATPAFDVTANSKYVAELTVNAAATSAYDYYGLNLHFTKSVA